MFFELINEGRCTRYSLFCDKTQFISDMHAQMSILRDIIYGSIPHGADLQRVCAALGLDPQDLNDSERLVPFKPAAEVWDVVIAETKNLFLGLQLGEKINPSILGLMGYLMQSSRTLHEAISVLARFNDLHSTMMKYRIETSGDEVLVHYEPAVLWQHQYPESVRQSIELAMSAMVTCTSSPPMPNSGGSTVMNNQAYTLYSSTWKILFSATSPAAYSLFPSASSFQTTTMAMHRARPMRIRPDMYSG